MICRQVFYLDIERIMKTRKVAIFDFDGTLWDIKVDWKGLHSKLSSVGRQFGHVGVFSTLKEAYEWSGNVYGSRNRLIEVQNEFEMEGLPGTVVPAGKAAARWRTAKGMRCAVLSLNTSSTIEKVVGSWGFYPIISVDKVNRVKPDPEGLFLALDALGCKPGEAVLIGNSDTDRRCAEAASVDHIDVSAIKEEWFQ